MCAICKRKSSNAFIASLMSWRASTHGLKNSFSIRYRLQNVSAANSAGNAVPETMPPSPITSPGPMRPASNFTPARLRATVTTPDSIMYRCSLTWPAGKITSPGWKICRVMAWLTSSFSSSLKVAAKMLALSSNPRAFDCTGGKLDSTVDNQLIPAACKCRYARS
ncbi:hypothetical protein D3C87_1603040 [compost metagenome]